MNDVIGTMTTWGGVAAFVVLSGGLFLIWRDLGKRTDQLGTSLDGKIKNADERLGGRIERLGGRMERVESRLGERITRVENRLMNSLFSFFGMGTLTARSPLHLNKLGRAVSREIKGAEWADEILDATKERADGLDAYGIQEFCFDLVECFAFTPEKQREIRDSAFRHGLPAEQIRRVLAVELRDKLLKLAGLETPWRALADTRAPAASA